MALSRLASWGGHLRKERAEEDPWEAHGQRTLLECESWIGFKISLLHTVAPAVIPRLLWPLDPGEVPCARPHLERRRTAPAAWTTSGRNSGYAEPR